MTYHLSWPRVQGWPDPERWLTIALHSVRLHPQHAQRHARQRLFLMYSFLPSLCPAEEQCTHSLPATDTLLTFQHVQVCKSLPMHPEAEQYAISLLILNAHDSACALSTQPEVMTMCELYVPHVLWDNASGLLFSIRNIT